MSSRTPSRNHSTNAPSAPRARPHLRRALDRTVCARTWSVSELVFVVAVCLALSLWVAFGVALKHRDQVNTWIDVMAAAVVFSLWALGQGLYVAVAGQERRALVHRGEELEMARQRGREEMRRELGHGEV